MGHLMNALHTSGDSISGRESPEPYPGMRMGRTLIPLHRGAREFGPVVGLQRSS